MGICGAEPREASDDALALARLGWSDWGSGPENEHYSIDGLARVCQGSLCIFSEVSGCNPPRKIGKLGFRCVGQNSTGIWTAGFGPCFYLPGYTLPPMNLEPDM